MTSTPTPTPTIPVAAAEDAPKSFIAYEYSTLAVPREKEALYRDTYRAFGWTVEGYTPGTAIGGVTLKLKRDRALRSRAVLTELQRSAETALRSITDLERSRTTGAAISSISIGIAGAALLAGSIFTMDPDLTVLSIALGVVGLIGWVLPWFVHRSVKARRTVKVAPLVDRQYDVVYDSCARAASLLA